MPIEVPNSVSLLTLTIQTGVMDPELEMIILEKQAQKIQKQDWKEKNVSKRIIEEKYTEEEEMNPDGIDIPLSKQFHRQDICFLPLPGGSIVV